MTIRFDTALGSESYGGDRAVDKCQACHRYNVLICTHLDDLTISDIAINEWIRNARTDCRRQPVYGISQKFRIVSRPAGRWVLQKQVLAKGTAEVDPWSDVRMEASREEALDQLEQTDGYRQFLSRSKSGVAPQRAVGMPVQAYSERDQDDRSLAGPV